MTGSEHTTENEHSSVKNIPAPTRSMTEVSFSFRTDKLLGTKRPTLKLTLPHYTWEGLTEALSNEENPDVTNKVILYVLDVVNAEVTAAARSQVNDDDKPVNSQSDLDLSKLTLEYLATQPKSERAKIDKETWTNFAKDYITIMPGLTQKSLTAVGRAAELFTGKLNAVKSNKKVLAILAPQLDLWATHTTEMEEFGEIYDLLKTKLDTYLKADDEDLVAAL